MEKEKDSKGTAPTNSQDQPLSLARPFKFYFKTKKQDRNTYVNELKPLGSFSTVEGFWSYYRHINRPDKLPDECDVYLFLENVQPMWEDEANEGGGQFMLRFKPPYAGKFWEDLLIGFIGEQCPESDCITGVVLSVRSPEIWIKIWIKRCTQDERDSIEAWLRSTFGLTEAAYIEYKPHRNTKQQHKTIGRSDEATKHRVISEK